MLHTSWGVTAGTVSSISVASHNSLCEPSELHYCRLRGVDCCVTTLVNFHTPGLGFFVFILSPASFVIMIFNQGDWGCREINVCWVCLAISNRVAMIETARSPFSRWQPGHHSPRTVISDNLLNPVFAARSFLFGGHILFIRTRQILIKPLLSLSSIHSLGVSWSILQTWHTWYCMIRSPKRKF